MEKDPPRVAFAAIGRFAERRPLSRGLAGADAPGKQVTLEAGGTVASRTDLVPGTSSPRWVSIGQQKTVQPVKNLSSVNKKL